MSDEYEECDRCEKEFDELQKINLGIEKEVCEACQTALIEEVDYYDWRDRYTEDQHERAVSILSDRPEVECVLDDYERGQIIVHTNYVSSDVVYGVCEHFGFKIDSFGPQWYKQGEWPCLDSHESVMQIVLTYDHTCEYPIPTSCIFEDEHIDNLDGNDEQF